MIIRIGRQWDGCVYRLDSLSKRRLKAAHPRTHVVPTVLIGYDPAKRDQFEARQASMWPQIAQILTGVSLEKLRAFGGVVLIDPEVRGWQRTVV